MAARVGGARSVLPMLAAFVDAGFLRGIGADRRNATPAGQRIEASGMAIVGAELVGWVNEVGSARVLRTYVYDALYDDAHDKAEVQGQLLDELADTDGINLRLGDLRERKGRRLEQKGVDTMLVLDVLQLAQQGSYDDALLIAGDSDFLDVVDAVQRLGKHVWVGCSENRNGLAKDLRQRCDGLRPIPNERLGRLVIPSWR